jgi:hypothetical protein
MFLGRWWGKGFSFLAHAHNAPLTSRQPPPPPPCATSSPPRTYNTAKENTIETQPPEVLRVLQREKAGKRTEVELPSVVKGNPAFGGSPTTAWGGAAP